MNPGDKIFDRDRGSLKGNTEYLGTECIAASSCYKFEFVDSWGDGLVRGGLTLKQDFTVVLDIGPYDLGLPMDDSSATKWEVSFGNGCSAS